VKTAHSATLPAYFRGNAITFRHTTIGRTSLDKSSARSIDTRRLKTDIHASGRIRTSKPRKRATANYALDHTATWIGKL